MGKLAVVRRKLAKHKVLGDGKLSIISRVVVHPKYRSIGLGEKLIRESLPLVGTPYVELVAVMARYNPFAERAGMCRVLVQEPCRQARKLSAVLVELGFDLRLLGSESYVLGKLRSLGVLVVSSFHFNWGPNPTRLRNGWRCHVL